MKHREEPNFPAKQGRHLSTRRSQDPSCYTTPSLPEAIKRSDLMPSYLGYLAQKHLLGLQQDALPSISPSGTVFEADWRSVPIQMGHICSPDQVTRCCHRAASFGSSASSRTENLSLTFPRQEQFLHQTAGNEETRGCLNVSIHL